MQKGGRAIRASVLQAQSKSTNSYFLQLAISKPRAFKTLPENYLQSVFGRNYLTHSSYFIIQRNSDKFCKFFQINLFLAIHPLQNIDLY